RPVNGLDLHDHSHPPAERIVVGRPMGVVGEVPQRDDAALERAVLAGGPDHSPLERGREELRKDGEDRDLHEQLARVWNVQPVTLAPGTARPKSAAAITALRA